jgi:hypothetical protein
MARPGRAAAAALLLAALGAACSSSHRRVVATSTTTPPTLPPSTTTTVPPVLAPLTGLPDPSGAGATRPALTVKIENTPAARPQIGIDHADVVYEEVVECSITRLAAIFQSDVPAVIGPVRSVRRTDQAIVRPLRGIFVYSGGAPYAITSIGTAPVVRLDETTAGSAMYRDRSRAAPHNLYAYGPALYAKAPAAVGPPPPLFQYRSAATPAVGTPAQQLVVGFQNGYAVTWTWDAPSRAWLRSIFGRPDTVAGGAQIHATNVVIQQVNYVDRLGGACGDVGGRAAIEGTTRVIVLSGGRVQQGAWTRPDPTQPGTLQNVSGGTILLTPGNTWVELPKPSYAITVTPPAVAASTTVGGSGARP